jgi:hypothetical protein
MLPDRLQQDERQRAKELFEGRMAALFDQLPMLSGFHVRNDLSVTELSISTWPGWRPAPALGEDIAHFLQEMVDDQPAVAELLRGRTFARTLQ